MFTGMNKKKQQDVDHSCSAAVGRQRKIVPRPLENSTQLISYQCQTLLGHEIASSSRNEQIIILPASYTFAVPFNYNTPSSSSSSILGNLQCENDSFLSSGAEVLEKHQNFQSLSSNAKIPQLDELTPVQADYFLKRFMAFPYVLNGEERDKMSIRLNKDPKTLRYWFSAQRDKMHQLHLEGLVSARSRSCPICGVFNINDDFSYKSFDAWQAHMGTHINYSFAQCFQCLTKLRCTLALTMHIQWFHNGNSNNFLRCRNCFAQYFDAKALLLHESECLPLEFETSELISYHPYNSISFSAEISNTDVIPDNFSDVDGANLVPLVPNADDENGVAADNSEQIHFDDSNDVFIKLEEPMDLK